MRGRLTTVVALGLGMRASCLRAQDRPRPSAFPGANGKMVFGGLDSVRLTNPDGSGSGTIPGAGRHRARLVGRRALASRTASNRDPWTLRVIRVDGTERP